MPEGPQPLRPGTNLISARRSNCPAPAYEPDPTNNNSLTLQTSYAYSALDELTQITQGVGVQTRTYVYDALGRLLSATTPEAGRVCFGSVTGSTCNADGYDSFDNLQKRTDARGVLTSYGYDTLNRLTSVSYNVTGAPGVPATSGVTLTYGSTPAQFNNGRLITMTDGVGSENYTYNNLGEMTQLQKIINGTTYTTSYGYNIANELTQITYPSNRVVQQSVDAIGRLCEVASSTTGCGTAASPYATGYGYNAAGLPTGFRYGNGIYASFGFSSDRLQLNCLDYSTTNRNGNCTHDSTTKFGLNYSYGTSGSNNGQIGGITDSVESGRNATYTYDALYRLTNASTIGSTNYPAWGLSETYDRYGNRSLQSTSSGCAGNFCPTNSVTIDATTNRISGSPYAYDLSGNMTNDGSNTLVYDAENHAVSASNGSSSGAYIYDGNGLRVKKCVPNCTSPTSYTTYVFSGSKVIAEYDNGAAVGSPSREYIYSGAALLAKIDSSGTKYYHQDHLSNRLVTDSSGNTLAQMGHFPYGESWYNGTNDKLLFTTYERDSESGNDYAMARYHVSRLGRLSSPDPLGGSTVNPQSLNRYSYSINDPANITDPSGLQPCLVEYHDRSTSEQSSSGVGPSNAGLSEDSGQPEPQFICGGPGGGGGGVFLDGGDITDNSGSAGMGFPIGGGGFHATFTTTQSGTIWQWVPGGQVEDAIYVDDGNGNWILSDQNTFDMIPGHWEMVGGYSQTTTQSIDLGSPDWNLAGSGSAGGGGIGIATMGPQTNWFHTKQAHCLAVAAKEGVGGLVMKKEIDAAADFLLGDPNAVTGVITPGSVAVSAEQGMENIAANRTLIRTVRSALRDEGWKVSGNALARGAKFLGRAALVAHAAFAAFDGSEAYNACMAN